MKRLQDSLVILIIIMLVSLSVSADEADTSKHEIIRTGMAIAGALAGFGIGIDSSMGFVEYSTNDLTIADKLFVIIPTTIVFTCSSALASWWIADQTVALEPSLLMSPLIGAGLGAAACAFVGGVSFPVLATTGTSERIGVSSGTVEGIELIPVSAVAGAFWGGLAGIPIGAVTVPIISLYVGF